MLMYTDIVFMQGEIAGDPEYVIYAEDKDEEGTDNSRFNFTVLSVISKLNNTDLKLFEAITQPDYQSCK